MILHSSIPCLYKNTYTKEVEDFLLVYNPLGEKGIVLLNKEAAFLFRQIDNRKNIEEIFAIAKKIDKKIKLSDIIRIFNNFLSSDIIYFEKKKNKNQVFGKKPKHLGVWFHITNQCNLRCSYCYVWKSQEKISKTTAEKALFKIIHDAKKHHFKKITIKFSGGEPLLEFSLILRLVRLGRKLAREKKMKIEFVILTNGVLLTKRIAEQIKKENIRVAVSLDGLREYHDRQRIFPDGTGSFKYVEKGIKNLQEAKVNFNVSVTITSKNIENIPQLTRYLLKRNIPFAFNFYRENSCVKEELEADNKKLIYYLKKAYKIIYQNPPPFSLINGLLDRVSFARPHLYPCGMGVNYLVVRHDGKIVSCQMTLEKPIGSIDDKDLIKTMINGNFVRPKNLTVEDKTPCKSCQWKYLCCGGCPLLTFNQKGRYDVNSPYCEVYKTLIPEVLKIEAKRLIKYCL